MPELPEVETVVRGLRASVLGRRIREVRFGKTDFIEAPQAVEQALVGSRILAIERYGKFISIKLEPEGDANAPVYLSVHLGMTGNMRAVQVSEPVAPHTHVFLALDDGRELRYTDPRRFGRIRLVREPLGGALAGKLGADPLEINERDFHVLLGGRRAMIKALLLDQRMLRGMGNIYADESLWRAKVHPAKHASRLTRDEARRLHRAMQKVLLAAIESRGSSISDYRDANGNPGDYQLRHRAYGREGKRCARCGAKIRRMIVAGRSSFFCPRCQRPPRRRAK